MNIQQIRRTRLRQLLAEVKPAELARLSGVSPSYLSRLKHEIDTPSAKNMGEVMARKLEKAARKPPGWMDTLTESFEEAEFAGTMMKLRRLPVVGTAKMGDEGYYEEISSIVGAGDGHIEIAVDDPNAYGIRVRGQSMFPAIRDGWYVLVKPNATPREGEYVLLKFADGRKMVKEFLFRRDTTIEVMSVNGGERHTIELADLDGMHPVGAIVSPSQWRPD
jgi:phage repressor protein C with HTH and peptisase S24 domain